MSRPSTRLLLPTLALIALTLLTPTLATAFPRDAILRSAAERPDATLGLFDKLWDLLSAIWTTGSILDPDGAASATVHNAASIGDTGSGLDPNG